jgi:hypothetical protein
MTFYALQLSNNFTYDHRFKNIALPVRSAVLKLVTGRLVVRWVTTGEYLLLYVFDDFYFLLIGYHLVYFKCRRAKRLLI